MCLCILLQAWAQTQSQSALPISLSLSCLQFLCIVSFGIKIPLMENYVFKQKMISAFRIIGVEHSPKISCWDRLLKGAAPAVVVS